MKNSSIKRKLSLIIIFSGLFFGIFGPILIYYYTKNTELEQEKQTLLSYTKSRTDEVSEIFSQSQKIVGTIAKEPSIIEYMKVKKNSNTINPYMIKGLGGNIEISEGAILRRLSFYNIGGDYSAIYLINREGVTLNSTDSSFINQNYSFREYFQKSILGKPWVYMAIGVTSKKPGYYFSYPIKDSQGEILGMAVIKLGIDRLDEANQIITHPNGNEVLMLTDNYGVVISSSDENRNYKSLGILENKELDYLATQRRFEGVKIISLGYGNLEKPLTDYHEPSLLSYIDGQAGKDKLLTVAQIKDFPFYLVIEKQVSELINIATIYALYQSLFVLLIILVFATLLWIFFDKSIVQPLSKLYRSVNQISAGQYDDVEKVDVTDETEIGQLSSAFYKMVVKLKTAYLDLENQIKELNESKQEVNNKNEELKSRVDDLAKAQEAILNVAEDSEEEKHRTIIEKDKINAILHSIGDGVFVVDKDLKVILINEVAAKMSGYEINEILGLKFDEKLKFVFEDTGKINDQFLYKAMETKIVQQMSNHSVIVDKAGDKIPVSDSAAPLLDKEGNVIGCTVVFRDVSKEREIEKLRVDFLTLVSHQLRTPLSGTKWLIETMQRGVIGEINQKEKEYLESLNQINERMISLVSDILNVLKLESGVVVLKKENISVLGLVKDLFLIMDPVAKEKNIKIISNIGDKDNLRFSMQSDFIALRTILENFISNSICYSVSGQEIVLDMKENSEEIVFSVQDNGIGIPKEEQDRISERFYRGSNAKVVRPTGTGLGLYTSTLLAKNIKAKITFESEENKGTTFYLHIPKN